MPLCGGQSVPTGGYISVKICSSFLDLIFSTTSWGKGCLKWLTMVLLGRVMVCSHKLSVQTTVVSDTI